MERRKRRKIRRKHLKHKSKSIKVKKRVQCTEPATEKESKTENSLPPPILCKKSAKGLERLLCPYNTFEIKRPDNYKNSKMQDLLYKTGLSSKERTYLMCCYHKRPGRYAFLKAQAEKAKKDHKIFLIYGQCCPLRRALINRGWVEKIPVDRMDLSTIRCKSNSTDNKAVTRELERILQATFVEHATPNLIWNYKTDLDSTDKNSPIKYSRLKQDTLWTSKQGLCNALKNYHWYHIENKAEVSSPRTYVSSNGNNREEFLDDYKLTACSSLLKWLLSMVTSNREIFSSSGKIGINVIVFALNRCKEYLKMKQHLDIDSDKPSGATKGQWNSFLRKYSSLIWKQEIFVEDKENKIPIFLEYAKFLLKQMYFYRPQLSCEGCYNIWIVKPGHCSRGRGIRLASNFSVLCDLLYKNKYVFQKYIEEPLLVHETKFDIRQYYLITSMCPLEIWMYKDCYLKFSSQKYNLKNFHQSIHLTNHAVQRHYKNCRDRHPDLPQSNMWNLQTYKEYLRKENKEHIWDKVIYPGMRKAILGAMLCCQESTSRNDRNRFELYGCDFIIDKDYKPWLIEINSSPDLTPTTPVTGRICAAVLEDLVKVILDRAKNPKASTGLFECIYKQNIMPVTMNRSNQFMVYGHALPLSYFSKDTPPVDEEVNEMNEENPQDEKFIIHQLKEFSKNAEMDPDVEPKSSKTYITEEQEELFMIIKENYQLSSPKESEQLYPLVEKDQLPPSVEKDQITASTEKEVFVSPTENEKLSSPKEKDQLSSVEQPDKQSLAEDKDKISTEKDNEVPSVKEKEPLSSIEKEPTSCNGSIYNNIEALNAASRFYQFLDQISSEYELVQTASDEALSATENKSNRGSFSSSNSSRKSKSSNRYSSRNSRASRSFSSRSNSSSRHSNCKGDRHKPRRVTPTNQTSSRSNSLSSSKSSRHANCVKTDLQSSPKDMRLNRNPNQNTTKPNSHDSLSSSKSSRFKLTKGKSEQQSSNRCTTNKASPRKLSSSKSSNLPFQSKNYRSSTRKNDRKISNSYFNIEKNPQDEKVTPASISGYLINEAPSSNLTKNSSSTLVPKILSNTKTSSTTLIPTDDKSKSTLYKIALSGVLAATKNLVLFLKQKEKEYTAA